jgi:hypothetical protein
MGAHQKPRGVHHGRVTESHEEPTFRPRRRAVTLTAWLVVGGLALAVIAPVVALLFS